MIPILYQSLTEGSVPTNYGIGALTDCISCEVPEERNGKYELTLVYAASGIHASEIEPNRFIKAKPNYTDNPQLFRIYKVGKVMNGKFTVYAEHISYDLSGKLITSGTASSCAGAITLLQAKAGAFTLATDISASKAFSIDVPSSVRSWFGGKAGSLLDLYGGEWYYDNYSATLKSARGSDRGVTIRYGKNLTQLSQELDMSNLVTGIVPYYIDANGNKTVGNKVSTGLTLDVPRDIAIDFSQEVDPESSTAITTQLANLANAYKNSNNLVSINNSITLDFVQSGKLTERVDLCDTVHIYFEALGITATAKCIATTWDVLKERYTKTVFGSARTNIADTIASNTRAVENAADRAYVNSSSQLITGNLGGYVILHDSNGDGKPDEILVMNTDNPSTATQVWRFNKGGLGYGNSYSGPFNDIALTSDGKINASRIVTGTLTANVIKAGILSDANGNSSIDMTTGAAIMNDFKSKIKFSLVNSSNVSKADFYISGGNTYLTMRPSSSTNDLVKIWAQDANGSGVLQLLKSNGNLIMETGLTSENGGGIGIRNSSNINIGEFRTNSYGGALTLKNNSGNSVCELNAASAGDGVLQLRNSSGTVTIYGFAQSGDLVCVTLYQTSSRKVKENIKPIEDAEKILELDAVSFDYKDKALGTDKRGFIAEDVAEILPNLVKPESEGRNASLDYLQMIPYLQAVIKEQDKRIKALESKLEKLGG